MQNVFKFLKDPEFFYVRGPYWTSCGPRVCTVHTASPIKYSVFLNCSLSN